MPLDGKEDSPWPGKGRLRRILGRQVSADATSRIVERWPGDGNPDWHVTWLDTGHSTPAIHSPTGTVLHVLWTPDRRGTWVEFRDDPDDPGAGTRAPIAPGDTLTVPPGTTFSLGPDGLALAIGHSTLLPAGTCGREGDGHHPSPTHGLQVFDGYNRRTFCAVKDDLVLERWKLTRPLALELARDRWHLLVNLVEPVALAWPGGSRITARASSWLVPNGLERLTVVPDNLGYILLAYQPDLERDVISPLRAAGYDPETIASIGVPRGLLGK